jgi:transcriptional regulator with XRE-family HTH domain
MEKANISRIESGKRNPTFLILSRLSRALGLSLSELFNDDCLNLILYVPNT